MFLAAIHKHEQEVTSNNPNKQIIHGAPGRSSTERESDHQNQREGDGQGKIADGPNEIPPEHVPDGGHVGKVVDGAVVLGRPSGESQ